MRPFGAWWPARAATMPNMNLAEATFAQQLNARGALWFHQPRKFRTSAGNYVPDFYVVDDGRFYEVVGTRQAYSYQRRRIAAFQREYPHLRLEIVNIGAWKGGALPNGRKPVVKRGIRGTKTKGWRNALRRAPTDRHDIIRAALARGIGSYTELGLLVGMPTNHVRDALLGPEQWGTAVRGRLREALSA